MVSGRLSTTPVLILAGGLGTRLRSVVADRPKGMADIGSRRFLEIQIELLRDQGARRFVLCVGHLATSIQQHFGDGSRFGIHVDYSVEGEQLLGTGGALGLARRYFLPRALVLNGDTFFPLDFNRLVDFHMEQRQRADVQATLVVAHAPDSGRYGNVVLDASGGYLARFAEKVSDDGRSTGWLSAGAYVIERDLIDTVPADRACSLERDVFPGALAAGTKLAALTSDQQFYDIGTPEGLQTFTDYYLQLAGH